MISRDPNEYYKMSKDQKLKPINMRHQRRMCSTFNNSQTGIGINDLYKPAPTDTYRTFDNATEVPTTIEGI